MTAPTLETALANARTAADRAQRARTADDDYCLVCDAPATWTVVADDDQPGDPYCDAHHPDDAHGLHVDRTPVSPELAALHARLAARRAG